MVFLRVIRAVLVLPAMVGPWVPPPHAQPRASLQVWYSIRNDVPVYATPTLSSRRIARVQRSTPVCVLALRGDFAHVRLVRSTRDSKIEGFVEQFALAKLPVTNRSRVSVSDACFPPAVVASQPPGPRRSSGGNSGDATPDSTDVSVGASQGAADSVDRAAATTEFRRLALAQESFWAEKGTYATSLNDLSRFYVPTASVVTQLLGATDEGWDARVTVIRSGFSCVFRSRVADPEGSPPQCGSTTAGGSAIFLHE
jgi:hypothetical protein